ncbi:MAG: energy transducer TonB [Ignavibacteriales bacterium]|nr:energy transducer TonB [Ignavibacteriales bacterium]
MKKNLILSSAVCLLLAILLLNTNIFAQDAKKEGKAKICEKVEVMPEYIGGTDALINKIAREITYPELAKRACIQGKVMVEFVVDKEGNVTDAKILKGIGSGCDEEALRVVNALGKFKPGTDKGKSVAVSMVIPIKFKLDDKIKPETK